MTTPYTQKFLPEKKSQKFTQKKILNIKSFCYFCENIIENKN
jgi:hypothetical protein